MDPIANVAEQRQVAASLLDTIDNRPDADQAAEGEMSAVLENILAGASRLAELVDALDTWRRNGGFDPYAAIDGTPQLKLQASAMMSDGTNTAPLAEKTGTWAELHAALVPLIARFHADELVDPDFVGETAEVLEVIISKPEA